jgi:hypothetical protein
MDPDLVVPYLIRGLLVLGAVLAFGAFATWLVGWLCRRAAVSHGLTVLAQVLTPVALFYAGSLYLDVAGFVTPARVIAIEEKISYGSHIPGDWSRQFWASVTFNAPEGPRQAPLWIDEATYDALWPGASLVVRYLPSLPFIARPADQSTRSFVPWRWLAIGAAALGVGIGLRPLFRRAPAALQAFGVLTALLIAVLWLVFPTPWDTPLEPPILTASAEVRDVRAVTHSFLSGRRTGTVPAPQPWNLVELHFVPAGRNQAVIAIDGVDEGSVQGLRVGARLPVTYRAGNPRDARLAGARTYRWREWVELARYAVGAVAVIGGFLLLAKLASLWWRRMTTRS